MLTKIVLTGARGNLGHELRGAMSKMCETLVSTDIQDAPDTLFENENYVQADIADMAQVAPLMDGVEMVVHFGALVDEVPFEEIWGPNFVGAYNVFESAYQAGARRVVYASSIHAVGMAHTNAGTGIDAPHQPDTFYGLAKCFTEDLGKMYWDKRGFESVHLRILSCTPEPQNARALGTWLSYPDMVHLVERAVNTPTTGFTVIYGVSNNDRAPVDNTKAAFLGYRPKDNAEDYAEALLANVQSDSSDIAQMRVGGPFAAVKLGQSGIAAIKAMTENES
ncbi:NAD(P)-dependent oxidoreductase [Thalassobium sp. R2A62]|jgi:uronate dehydrogenase|uniref:NAD-dependent epimerase/dehydratase family protein n=1 Tax=Thalassobium sp. R2A62 TaxID=633131 RepID=UPI0001B1D03D|nr:NAD(P)-dependent oxidoreductase [Thalassobium sp. R2A62]EET47094.1 3-beta hydroxysteroid dehydrogenase/isomerase [Thalassobium sp. R2A62]